MADFTVSVADVTAANEAVAREVQTKTGKTFQIFIREMTEKEQRQRENQVLDPMVGRGKKKGNSLRLDKQRAFDFNTCLIDWTIKQENGETWPVNPQHIAWLGASVSNQIHEHIREYNNLPEDDEFDYIEEDEETGEERTVKDWDENPTS